MQLHRCEVRDPRHGRPVAGTTAGRVTPLVAVGAAIDAPAITLEIAPAYVSEEQAAEWLAPFADEVGETLERALAARRYAATGDLRSLQGGYL